MIVLGVETSCDETSVSIVRDGKEIELTQEELRAAWEEAENRYRREDIESRYELPDNKVEEAIKWLSRLIDYNDNYWDLYWSMIDDVAEQLKLKDVCDE